MLAERANGERNGEFMLACFGCVALLSLDVSRETGASACDTLCAVKSWLAWRGS